MGVARGMAVTWQGVGMCIKDGAGSACAWGKEHAHERVGVRDDAIAVWLGSRRAVAMCGFSRGQAVWLG